MPVSIIRNRGSRNLVRDYGAQASLDGAASGSLASCPAFHRDNFNLPNEERISGGFSRIFVRPSPVCVKSNVTNKKTLAFQNDPISLGAWSVSCPPLVKTYYSDPKVSNHGPAIENKKRGLLCIGKNSTERV
jgi:hypothetical protein